MLHTIAQNLSRQSFASSRRTSIHSNKNNNSKDDDTWYSAFTQNTNHYISPPAFLIPVDKTATPPSPKRTNSTSPTRRKSHNLNAGVFASKNEAYQLDVVSIDGVNVPEIAGEFVSVRVSLFDARSCVFFGKMWESGVIRVLNSGSRGRKRDEDSGSDSSDRSGSGSGSEDEGEDGIVENENVRNDSLSTTNEDEREESGDEEDVVKELRDSVSGSEGSHDRSDTQSSGGSECSEDESVVNGDEFEVSVSGKKLSIKFRNQSAIMHTSSRAPSIFAVLEIVFKVKAKKEQTLRKTISGGWTFFNLFGTMNNTEKGKKKGFNSSRKIISFYQGTPRVLVFIGPLLLGTLSGFPILSNIPGCTLTYNFRPRPDIPHRICSHWQENHFLNIKTILPGTTHKLGIDEKHLPLTTPTKPIFISNLKIGVYPAVQDFEHCLLVACAYEMKRNYPDLKLVKSSRLNSEKSGRRNPFSPDIGIIERRLKIGVHNSHVFVCQPVITSLQTKSELERLDDGYADRGRSRSGSRKRQISLSKSRQRNEYENWCADELRFKGRVDIPDFPARTDERVAIVFLVEYKLQMTVRKRNDKSKSRRSGNGSGVVGIDELLDENVVTHDSEKKAQGGLAGIFGKFGAKKSDNGGLQTIEKVVNIGWSWWVPTVEGEGEHVISMRTEPAANPFKSMFYQPTHSIADFLFSKLTKKAKHNNEKSGIMEKDLNSESESESDQSVSEDDQSVDRGRRHNRNSITKRQQKWKRRQSSELNETYLSTQKDPVILSFCFNTSDPSRAASPTQSVIPSSEINTTAPSTPKTMKVASTMTVPPPEIPNEPEDIGKIQHSDAKYSLDANIDIKDFMEMSRAERGRIMNAGFPSFRSNSNGTPSTTTTTGIANSIREFRMLFMGIVYNKNYTHDMGFSQHPTSVKFSFQFFHCGYTMTPSAHIYTGPLPVAATHHSFHRRTSSLPNTASTVRNFPHSRKFTGISNRMSVEDEIEDVYWPGILYTGEKDGTPKYSSPGINLNYVVDPIQEPGPNSVSSPPIPATNIPVTNPPIAPRTKITDSSPLNVYLSTSNLIIDVWDADSLMMVGTAVLPVHMLIADDGSDCVEWEGDVAVISAECLAGDIETDAQSTTSTYPSASRVSNVSEVKSPIAKIRLRLSNCKSKPNDLFEEKPTSPTSNKTAELENLSTLQRTMGIQSSLARSKRRQSSPLVVSDFRNIHNRLRNEHVSVAMKVEETVPDFEELIWESHNHSRSPNKDVPSNPTHAIRNSQTGSNGTKEKFGKQKRQEALNIIEEFRDRRKSQTVNGHLRDQITTRQTIYPSFGSATFFEFQFTNPFAHEHNFAISWDDQELRIVQDVSEWRYLRRIFKLPSAPLEPNLFTIRPDGTLSLFMHPNETISIPFLFQSYLSGLPTSTYSQKLLEEPIQPRVISVSFISAKENGSVVVAILDVRVCPRGFTIAHSMGIFAPENEMVRKLVYVDATSFDGVNSEIDGDGENDGERKIVKVGLSTVFDAAHPGMKYVRCTDDSVICSLTDPNPVIPTTFKELRFKYRVPGIPETTVLYFLFFDDPFLVSLCGIWRVFIHGMHKLDINCTPGQSNTTSIVLRGSSFPRIAHGYSSRPTELMVSTNNPFTLAPNVLNEVGILIRPISNSQRTMRLNVIDVEQRLLLGAWWINLIYKSPTITQIFDLRVARNAITNKKVSYTNPYNRTKTLHVSTDHSELLEFKEPVIVFEAGSTKYIGMRILPSENTIYRHHEVVEIHVFLNDEEDNNEECLCLKIFYQ
ncbi:hypothetical protein HK098_005945 [Nowakowskiella sp. JEL0407]|nr:hypothetical protein HK098_005945 [Nowakowskiella sp. JEL0407]